MRSRVHNKDPISKVWSLIILFLLLAMLFLLFINSSLSRVQVFGVEGYRLLSRQSIIDQTGVVFGESLLSINTSDIKHKLMLLPEVSNCEVSRSLPSRLDIKIQEKLILGFFQESDQKSILLSDGTKIPENKVALANSDHKILFTGIDNAILPTASLNLSALNPEILDQFISITSFSDDQLKIKTKFNHVIYIKIRDIPSKLNVYARFSSHPAGELHIADNILFSPASSSIK